MKHCTFSFGLPNISFCEHRLCMRNLEINDKRGELKEATEMPALIQKNNSLKEAISRSLMAGPDDVRKEPDRSYFQSLMLVGMRGTWNRADAAIEKRDDIHLAYALPFLREMKDNGAVALVGVGSVANFLRIGAYVREADESIAAQFTSAPLNDTPEQLIEIGKNYFDHLHQTEKDWQDKKETVSNIPLTLAATRYVRCKSLLNTILHDVGITVSHENEGAGGEHDLSGPEYLQILEYYWASEKMGEADIAIRSNAKSAESLRQFVAANKTPNSFHVLAAHTDLTIDTMESSKLLQRFGIEVDQSEIQTYIVQRKEQAAAGFPSAGTWLAHPERAVEFLGTEFADRSEGNKEFIRSVEWHLQLTDDERAARITAGEKAPDMDKNDTHKALQEIVNAFLLREKVLTQSIQARTDQITAKGLDAKAEGLVGKGFEYITDVRKHPVGSIMLALAAFLAARMVWRSLFGGGGRRRGWTWS